MIIQPLCQAAHFAPQVTRWLTEAFGGADYAGFYASIVQHSQQPGALPITFVANDQGQLCGTVGLWRCDLISRQDLWPWLAALYVDTPWRGQGLGESLQHHVMQYARKQGFSDLYLYSACKEYYERFGWRYIGDGLDTPDKPVHLYHQSL